MPKAGIHARFRPVAIAVCDRSRRRIKTHKHTYAIVVRRTCQVFLKELPAGPCRRACRIDVERQDKRGRDWISTKKELRALNASYVRRLHVPQASNREGFTE